MDYQDPNYALLSMTWKENNMMLHIQKKVLHFLRSGLWEAEKMEKK